MNKKLILAAAVVATLAGCAKNEINPVQTAEQEISFQTVLGPNTKTLSSSQSEFGKTNVFASYAFYLDNGSEWIGNQTNSKLYIDNALISYKNNLWKNHDKPYYWPKNGKLTFFSWSFNKENLIVSSINETTPVTVTCDNANGIVATNYSTEVNRNIDFMVADIAQNQSKNINTYGTDGVPTLFRHKLCQVKYTIKTDKDYYATNGYVFTLNSVKFSDVAQAGTYTQGNAPDNEKWELVGDRKAYEYESSALNTDFGTTAITSADSDQLYYIPQSFIESSTVTVKYTVTRYLPDDSTIVDEYEKPLALYDAKLWSEGWLMNKIYTLNITVSLDNDEIYWDPAVENWEEEDKSWTVE